MITTGTFFTSLPEVAVTVMVAIPFGVGVGGADFMDVVQPVKPPAAISSSAREASAARPGSGMIRRRVARNSIVIPASIVVTAHGSAGGNGVRCRGAGSRFAVVLIMSIEFPDVLPAVVFAGFMAHEAPASMAGIVKAHV